MKRYIRSSQSKQTGILRAKLGDAILDTKTGEVGKVVKEGQSGNYNIVYVDFGGKSPRRINPMDDAQRFGRYQFAD